MSQGKQIVYKPEIFFNILLWLFLVLELFIFIFLIGYWKDLQTIFSISSENPWAQAAFANPIVIGFLRSMVIALVPLIPFFLLSFTLRILLSSSGKFGPFEFEGITERLNQTETNVQRFDEILNELKRTQEENEQLKSIVATVVEVKQAQSRRK